MATAAIAGRIGAISLTTASAAVSAKVAEVRNWELNTNRPPINASSFDSSGWTEIIDGTAKWTVTCGAIYARADAEQVSLRKALINRVAINVLLQPSTSVTAKWTGSGRITGWSIGAGTDEVVSFTGVTVEGSGALTYTT